MCIGIGMGVVVVFEYFGNWGFGLKVLFSFVLVVRNKYYYRSGII